MGRPRLYDERTSVCFRLTKGTTDRLRKVAAERDVSINLIVQSAIDAHLEALAPVEEAVGRPA